MTCPIPPTIARLSGDEASAEILDMYFVGSLAREYEDKAVHQALSALGGDVTYGDVQTHRRHRCDCHVGGAL